MVPAILSSVPLLSGDAGTAQTLDAMRAFVVSNQIHPFIRWAVVDALDGVPEKSGAAEIRALMEWVQNRVRYMRDPLEAEYVQAPALMVESIRRDGVAVGDCDDMATLLATMAEAAGYPSRFVVVGRDGEPYGHVFTEIDVNGRWMGADPSAKHAGLGWAPAYSGGRKGREMKTMGLGEDLIETSSGGFFEDAGDFFSGLVKTVTGAAPTVLPLLERYGMAKPVTGYSPTGQPYYASTVLPVGGLPGMAYSGLSATGPLGLPMVAWLLIGGGALFLLSGKR